MTDVGVSSPYMAQIAATFVLGAEEKRITGLREQLQAPRRGTVPLRWNRSLRRFLAASDLLAHYRVRR